MAVDAVPPSSGDSSGSASDDEAALAKIEESLAIFAYTQLRDVMQETSKEFKDF